MSSDNPFNEAMDEAADDHATSLDEFDVDEFIAGLNDGSKTETIGIAVSEEMHALWRELRESDDVDVDVAESIRSHLEDLAQRHEQAAERAGRKLQIDREL
jgi:hypothetical protein